MTKEIYEYDERLYFRFKPNENWVNDLSGPKSSEVEFICPKHRVVMTDINLTLMRMGGFKLVCPLCERDEDYEPLRYDGQKFEDLQKKAFGLYTARDLENAKLVRLDDVYTPEIKGFDALKNKDSNYFIKSDVKTDIDGHTVVVLYVGYKGKKEKTQFFIKPEKLQLTHDHKDMDPAKVLAKVELTLKDRVITQKFKD